MSGDLTTLANLEEYLGLTVPPLTNPPSAATESMLSRLISAASNYMQTWMSRTIALQSYSEVRNGINGNRIVLKESPIVSVQSLNINGTVVPVRPPLGPGASIPPPWGYVNDDISIMLTGYRFCQGYQNIYVVYTAGYATTPPDIEQACIDLIGDWFKYRDRIGKASEGIEGQTISFLNPAISARALGVMQTYKRVYPVY